MLDELALSFFLAKRKPIIIITIFTYICIICKLALIQNSNCASTRETKETKKKRTKKTKRRRRWKRFSSWNTFSRKPRSPNEGWVIFEQTPPPTPTLFLVRSIERATIFVKPGTSVSPFQSVICSITSYRLCNFSCISGLSSKRSKKKNKEEKNKEDEEGEEEKKNMKRTWIKRTRLYLSRHASHSVGW